MKKFIIRFIIYITGLFLLSIGVSLSIRSNTGVSPVSSLPLVFSNITGLTMGTVTFIVYLIFILLQIIILKKDFKAKDLLQIAFSTVFGIFMDLSLLLLKNIIPSNYFEQILLLLVSILVISTGIFLILVTDLVINAPEGLCLAIGKKWNLKFSQVKVRFDIILVILSGASALIFLGNLSQLREGTVVAAICIGKVVGLLQRKYSDKIRKLFWEISNENKTVSEAPESIS